MADYRVGGVYNLASLDPALSDQALRVLHSGQYADTTVGCVDLPFVGAEPAGL